MNMRPSILLVLLCILGLQAFAQASQASEKYWVFLADKGDMSSYKAADLLSPKALERRQRHGIALDERDFPVSSTYLHQVSAQGAQLRHPSRWFNAVSAWMDAETAQRVAALPCVRKVERIKAAVLDRDAPADSYRLGYIDGHDARNQLQMVGLDVLHKNGYSGTGVTIAVMDEGFVGLNENFYFAHLFSDDRILATYDFVNGETDVYDEGSHGTWVLSILAGFYESAYDSASFYGSAHGANYMLFHTEEEGAETTREEDNWVAAMEFADSAGADIFSTSLGYREMDANSVDSYTAADMDGNTTIITRGADIAASKGIIVVNSAGNSGSGAGSITAPADGDSVIAVGAVNASRVISGFSSRGPTADGRLKPDVSAMGVLDSYVSTSAILLNGNGTSFSCPVVSGLLACALQAAPETRNMEMYEALIRSCNQFAFPDNDYGYGIPNGPELLAALGVGLLPATVDNGDLDAQGSAIFPNPTKDRLSLVYDNEFTAFPGSIQVFDEAGRLVSRRQVQVSSFYNVFHLSRSDELAGLPAGKYFIGLYREGQRKAMFGKTLILSE